MKISHFSLQNILPYHFEVSSSVYSAAKWEQPAKSLSSNGPHSNRCSPEPWRRCHGFRGCIEHCFQVRKPYLNKPAISLCKTHILGSGKTTQQIFWASWEERLDLTVREDLSTLQCSATVLTGLATTTSFWGPPSSIIGSTIMWVTSRTFTESLKPSRGVTRAFAAIHLHSASRSPCQGGWTVQLRRHIFKRYDRWSDHAARNNNETT